MDDARLQRLLAWGHCQSCMMVSEGWDVSEPDPRPCPNCRQSGYGFEWPPEPARSLLRQALSRGADRDEDLAVMGFLVATALDIMLEWILGAAVEYYSTDSRRAARLVDRVHDPFLSTEQRLDMLRSVTDVRYEDVAELVDAEEFPERWRELREARDRLLHSFETLAFQEISEPGIHHITAMAMKVFARLNNLVW